MAKLSDMQKFVNKINNRLRTWYKQDYLKNENGESAKIYNTDLAIVYKQLDEYSMYFTEGEYTLSTKKLNQLKEEDPDRLEIVMNRLNEIKTIKEKVKETVDPKIYKANQQDAIAKYLIDLDMDSMLVDRFLEKYKITGYDKGKENFDVREKLGEKYSSFERKMTEFGSYYHNEEYSKAREALSDLKKDYFSMWEEKI